MTDITEGLVAKLTTTTAFTAIAGTRLYPLVIPLEAARPAAAYQVISEEEEAAHDGPAEITEALIQLTLEGETYAQAVALWHAVKGALHGKRGTWGDVDVFEATLKRQDGQQDTTLAPVVRADITVLYRSE